MSRENIFQPKVSIIIPVFNGEDYLKNAVESALNQTYSNCEIIVVNDGSDDGGLTKKVAHTFGNSIGYFEKTNGGVSSAFNFGINKMTGEYFSWLSHDDEYYPNKIQIQINALNSLVNKNTILFSNTHYINGTSEIIHPKTLSTINNVNTDILQLQILVRRPLINGNTVLIPKNCFQKAGLFNENLKTSQDYDMWFRLSLHYPFHFINEPLVKTRIHNKQGSKNINSFIEESYSTKMKMINSLGEKELLNLSGENAIKRFYLKLFLRYVINGNENAGWPSLMILEKLFNRKSLIYMIIIHLYQLKVVKKILKLFKPWFNFSAEK